MPRPTTSHAPSGGMAQGTSPGHALCVAWWHTSLRATRLKQSVQTPSWAYEQKVTQRHRIVPLRGGAGVAVPQAQGDHELHLLHPGSPTWGWSVWQTWSALVADQQGRKVHERL